MSVKGYAKFLLIMAGLGGLLYGVDVGVIAAALPYIERTSTFDQNQIGWIVGIVTGEWKGTGPKTRLMLAVGTLVLVASFCVISFGSK